MGNGEKLPNEGQFALNLEADDGKGRRERPTSVFRVSDLTRPLMNVSQICEQGFQVVFKDSHALIVNASGDVLCRSDRPGQLYTAKMFKAPELFGRPS